MVKTLLRALMTLTVIGAFSYNTVSEAKAPRRSTSQTTIAATSSASSSSASSSSTSRPDFAFPDRVAADATLQLREAMASGDSRQVVKSLVIYALARNAVSPDFMPKTLQSIDSVKTIESDPCVKSLLSLLQARIYNGLYSRNRWKYDQRSIPIDSIDQDPKAWSGEQYKKRILSFIDEANTNPHPLIASPLRDWDDIIEANNYTYILYPTLYDLVAYNSIDILHDLDSPSAILPARYLTEPLLTDKLPSYAAVSVFSRRAHELSISLLDAHKDNFPAYVTAYLNNIACMSWTVNDNGEALSRAYMDAYELFKDCEWGGDALLAVGSIDSPYFLEACQKALARYPGYYRANDLRNVIARLSRVSAAYSFPSRVSPSQHFEIKIRLSNTPSAAVYVYRDPRSMDTDVEPVTIETVKSGKSTARYEVTVPADPMPYNGETTLTLSVEKPGRYFIYVEPVGSDQSTKDLVHYYTTCIDFAPLTVNFDNITYPYVVAGTDGAPLEGVQISYSKDYRSPFVKAGTSDADGTLPQGLNNISRLKYSLGDQVATENYTYSTKLNDHSTWYLQARAFTDLPLYHPGDSLHWAVVSYRQTGHEAAIAPHADLKIIFKDANHEIFDSVKVTTDASGRATGALRLPEDRLAGLYVITIQEGEKFLNSTNYRVNDYKLPTFEASVTDMRRNPALPDSVITITCNAAGYSGFPIADAKVAVTLSDASNWWWRSSTQPPFWSTQLTTDSQGNVTFNIPRDILEMSPSGGSSFKVNIDITSPAGETRSCQRLFSLGKPYVISFNAPSNIDIDKPLALNAHLYDVNGEECDPAPSYSFVRDGKIVATGITTTLPGSLKPGIYDIIAAIPDSAMASPVTCKGINLYNMKGDCPVETPLFVPVTSLTAQRNATIPIGTYYDNTNILVTKTVDGVIKSRTWYSPRRGMNEYITDVDPECSEMTLIFTTIHNHSQFTSTVTVTNGLTVQDLKVEVESFRDKVIPGTAEEITLHVALNDKPEQASVLLMMQSRAILSLAPYSPSFPPLKMRYMTPNLSNFYNSASGYYASVIKSYDSVEAIKPSLQLYGMRFGYNMGNIHIRGRKIANLNSAKQADMAEDVVVEAEESMVMYAAAPKAMATSAGTNDIFSVVTETAADEAMPDNGSAPSQTQPDNMNYRPSEIPLAFFAPLLSTDSLGNLSYTYRVPEANTSWTLQALAYTPSLLWTSLQRSVTASRPVMVQGTSPRFLRYGDTAELTASAMNATDSAISMVTTLSVLNPADMSVISSTTSTSLVAGGSSVVVSLPFTVPTGGQAVIYRVKTSGDSYSDGEQCLIPLLPASQPVTTSTTFYIDADSTSFKIAIPATGRDARATLYMYDNPLWEIVTALPALNTASAVTSTQAADNLFMASVARGIMNRYPAMRKGLAQWLSSDRSDSTLVSMLSRNDDLKQLALNATPWGQEAMSDTERLTHLALIFDDSNIEQVINRSIKSLQQLECTDGGIAWCPGYSRSSQWATSQVLTKVASLSERGYLPASKALDKTISNAVSYLDAVTALQISRDKGKGDYTNYVYIRTFLKSKYPSATLSQATRITVNNILNRWEREPVAAKAVDAIILYYNNYPSMARRVVASINAYALNSPSKGRWWYGLDADVTAHLLHAIEVVTPADTTSIKAVAQWLILAKTNQSWGSSSATSSTIDALLGALDVPQAVNGTTTVTLEGDDGSRVLTNGTPQLPGMLVTDISRYTSTQPTALTVNKNTAMPAMGAVITSSVQPFDSIAASSHPSIAINKRYNVARGTVTSAADTLSVGDRLKVQLVITVADDLDYVTIIDRRAACLEPVQQLSRYTAADGTYYYMEVTDSETRYYFDTLRHGTYVIDTDMNVMARGEYASGVATLQSQVNPSVVANSSSHKLTVK